MMAYVGGRVESNGWLLTAFPTMLLAGGAFFAALAAQVALGMAARRSAAAVNVATVSTAAGAGASSFLQEVEDEPLPVGEDVPQMVPPAEAAYPEAYAEPVAPPEPAEVEAVDAAEPDRCRFVLEKSIRRLKFAKCTAGQAITTSSTSA